MVASPLGAVDALGRDLAEVRRLAKEVAVDLEVVAIHLEPIRADDRVGETYEAVVLAKTRLEAVSQALASDSGSVVELRGWLDEVNGQLGVATEILPDECVTSAVDAPGPT